jgi:hypothetical protein
MKVYIERPDFPILPLEVDPIITTGDIKLAFKEKYPRITSLLSGSELTCDGIYSYRTVCV